MLYENFHKRLINIFCGMGMAALVAAFSILLCPTAAYAMEDGAYLMTINRSAGGDVTYTNPLTGVTEDGGTNIALGDSMCQSIVDGTALVEQSGGHTYVTLGLGLASNITNVRFKLMDASGNFTSVSSELTGSCSRDGDTCNHYCFEVPSNYGDYYVSPIIYVGVMGRDVQFFVKLNSSTLTAGTGVYASTKVSAASAVSDSSSVSSEATASSTDQTAGDSSAISSEVNEVESVIETETQEATEEVEATEALDATEAIASTESGNSNKDPKDTEKSKRHPVLMVILILVILAGIGGGVYFYRRKSLSNPVDETEEGQEEKLESEKETEVKAESEEKTKNGEEKEEV